MAADQAQLEWERRLARPAAGAAFAALVLQIGAQVAQASAYADKGDGDRGALRAINDNSGAVIASGALQAVSLFFIGAVLFYLFRATAARRPVPGAIRGVIVLAPLLMAVGAIWAQVDIVDVARDFVDRAPEGAKAAEERADDVLKDRSPVPLVVGFAGSIALAFAYVFVSLNAMRAGLLSRFMGILGVIIGALLVLPILPGGNAIVQLFWLGAAGVLFLGRWPGAGRGPAWETGEAEPWPVPEGRRGMFGPGPQADDDVEPEPPPEPEQVDRPASRKRRRKKR